MAPAALLERLMLSAPHMSTKQIIPAFIYGTAWKKEATADLVYQALCNGFSAVDTAAQPKHYCEDLVGAGISRAIHDGRVRRSQIYVQTKFTSVAGQDPDRMPYDGHSPLPEQVHASVLSSLRNFNVANVVQGDDAPEPYIDTLVLHSPMPSMHETMEVWSTLEQYVPTEIRHLGISNCNLFTLMELYERSTVKPSVVQNRFYASSKFDIGLRQFCQEKHILYQSFWTLSANPDLLRSAEVGSLAAHLQISPQSALYCLVLGLGNITILNGTTSVQHSHDDWTAVERAMALAKSDPHLWEKTMADFRRLIGQPKP